MKKIKKISIYLSLFLAVCSVCYIAEAQGPGFEGDVEDTPVDGGVSLIIIAAAGYGIKKLNDHKKKSK